MITCTNCGYESPESANFCPKCGTKLEHKAFCANCGEELIPGMPFCPACGTKAGTAPKAVKEIVPPPEPAKDNTQEIVDVQEFEEVVDANEEEDPAHNGFAEISFPLHYKNVWFVDGERRMMNSPWFVELDIFSNHMEYKRKKSYGNILTGGLSAFVITSSKAKKEDRVQIPFSQILNITFAKESGIDGQKLINMYMKDGREFHFALTTLNVKENERLYQTLCSLAAPYMN